MLAILLSGPAISAGASGVFTCRGADGEMTFSFAPCARSEPTEAVAVIEPSAISNAHSRFEQLDNLDDAIARVQQALEDVKAQYEHDLLNATGKTDGITATFEQTTNNLLHELSELRSQRGQVKRN